MIYSAESEEDSSKRKYWKCVCIGRGIWWMKMQSLVKIRRLVRKMKTMRCTVYKEIRGLGDIWNQEVRQ